MRNSRRWIHTSPDFPLDKAIVEYEHQYVLVSNWEITTNLFNPEQKGYYAKYPHFFIKGTSTRADVEELHRTVIEYNRTEKKSLACLRTKIALKFPGLELSNE